VVLTTLYLRENCSPLLLRPHYDCMTEQNQPSRKRKRLNVRRACDYCRTKHIKCDGASPCGKCVQNCITCVYTEDPVKRHKTEAKVEETETDSLSQALEKKNKEVAFWKAKYDQASSSLQDYKTPPPQPKRSANKITFWKLSAHLGVSSDIASWLSLYEAVMYPRYAVPVGHWNTTTTMSAFEDDLSWSQPETVELLGILAVAALASGFTKESNLICNVARQIHEDLGDTKHPSIAAGLYLVGVHYLNAGKPELSNEISQTAMTMVNHVCNDVAFKDNTKVHPHGYLRTIARRATTFTYCLFCDRKRQLVMTTESTRGLPYSIDCPYGVPFHIAMFLIWVVITKIWMRVSTNTKPPRPDGSSDTGYAIVGIDEQQFSTFIYELQAAKKFCNVALASLHPTVMISLKLMIDFTLAITYCAGGHTHEAVRRAKDIFATLGDAPIVKEKSGLAMCMVHDVCTVAILGHDGPFFVAVFTLLFKGFGPMARHLLRSLLELADSTRLIYEKSDILDLYFGLPPILTQNAEGNTDTLDEEYLCALS